MNKQWIICFGVIVLLKAKHAYAKKKKKKKTLFSSTGHYWHSLSAWVLQCLRASVILPGCKLTKNIDTSQICEFVQIHTLNTQASLIFVSFPLVCFQGMVQIPS